jgi:hypothetical protein
MEQLADSPSLVRIMGKMARARALEFTWDRFAAGLDDSIERVVESRDLPRTERALMRHE